jgi:hypothetical protein
MDRGPAAGHPVNGEEGPRAGHKTGSCRLPEVGHELAARDHHRRSPGWIRSRLVRVRVVVTEIGWDGNMRHRVPGTAGLTGAGRWDNIMKQILPPAAPRSLRAVLPMSRTTVASVIRSRCDPTARQTPEPSSAPRPRRLGEHRRSDGRQGRPAGRRATAEQKFRRCLPDYDLMAGAYETLAAGDDWMFDDDAFANERAINQPATARRPGQSCHGEGMDGALAARPGHLHPATIAIAWSLQRVWLHWHLRRTTCPAR